MAIRSARTLFKHAAIITAAICTGRESHENPSKLIARVRCRCLLHPFEWHLRRNARCAIHGLPGYLSSPRWQVWHHLTIGGSPVGAMADARTREASLITFCCRSEHHPYSVSAEPSGA